MTLPGSMYQKNSRWWWKVRLPGETRTKARALKPADARFAATDRKVAEEVAREMWRLAIEAETEARFKDKARAKADKAKAREKAKAAEAITKTKTEYEEKLKVYKKNLAGAEEKAKTQATELAKTRAEFKAQAEHTEQYYAGEITKIRETIEKAKTEYEDKLQACRQALLTEEAKVKAQAEERSKTEAELKAKAERLEQYYAGEIAKIRVKIEKAKVEFEERDKVYNEALARAEEKAKAEAQARAVAEAKLKEVLANLLRTGACECCGKKDVPQNDLSEIDSGQLLCRECLQMLRG